MIDLTPPRRSNLRRAWHKLNRNNMLGDIAGGAALFGLLIVMLVLTP